MHHYLAVKRDAKGRSSCGRGGGTVEGSGKWKREGRSLLNFLNGLDTNDKKNSHDKCIIQRHATGQVHVTSLIRGSDPIMWSGQKKATAAESPVPDDASINLFGFVFSDGC